MNTHSHLWNFASWRSYVGGLLYMCVERFIIRLVQGYGGWEIQGPALFKLETPGGCWFLKAPKPKSQQCKSQPKSEGLRNRSTNSPKDGCPSSSSQENSTFLSFCSIQTLKRLDEAHAHCRKQFASVSLQFKRWSLSERASPNNHAPASWSSPGLV